MSIADLSPLRPSHSPVRLRVRRAVRPLRSATRRSSRRAARDVAVVLATFAAVATTATAILVIVGPGVAAAEPSPTPQAQAMNAAWVEGLTPADLAPDRAVTCIVDTGAIVTPDTPATNPDGPIVARVGLGSISPDPGPTDTDRHGTHMAAAAIAPRNDWGTVGLQPTGHIILVRAQSDESRDLAAAAVAQGIQRCLQFAAQERPYRIAAISLSLGHVVPPSAQEAADIDELVGQVREQYKIAVVAAAGNVEGRPTQFPASAKNVLAVAAASSTGGLCRFASFDHDTDLFAPGCDVLQTTDLNSGLAAADSMGGSSESTVLVAQAISALCDLAPGLSGTDAEAALLQSARREAGMLVPDLAAAAQLIGASGYVHKGTPGRPSEQPLPTTTAGPIETLSVDAPMIPSSVGERSNGNPTSRSRRLELRRAKAVWSSRSGQQYGTLSVSVSGRRSGQLVRVSAYAGPSEFRVRRIARVTRAASQMRIRLRSKPRHAVVVLIPGPRQEGRVSRGLAVPIKSRDDHVEFRQ